jgi:hypothetical protein
MANMAEGTLDSSRPRVESVALPEVSAVSGDRHDAGARGAYVLRAHILEELGPLLRAEGIDALLVKGAALAMTVYPRPWDREMQDIDLLVRPGTRARVIRVLEGTGFAARHPPGRPLSAESLGEVVLEATCGGAAVLLEVHTQLDKVVSRPIEYGEIFDRACPAPGYPGLLVPAPEDHVLLVALHAATAEFGHSPASRDLALLLESGLDHAALIERAKRWRLETAVFVAFSALKCVAGSDVPDDVMEALTPGPLRLATLRRFYRPGHLPVAKRPLRLGWRWVLRQAPLRDDLPRWCVGVICYAGLRVAERLLLLARSSR